jgi:hypothetical protein
LEIKSKRARLNQNKKVEVIQPYVLVPQAFSTESDGFEQRGNRNLGLRFLVLRDNAA